MKYTSLKSSINIKVLTYPEEIYENNTGFYTNTFTTKANNR